MFIINNDIIPSVLIPRINRMRQSGIYDFWIRETVLANNPTKKQGDYIDPNEQTFDYDRLTFADCRIIFYLLIILLSFASTIFVGEILLCRSKLHEIDYRRMSKHICSGIRQMMR